MFTNKKSVIIWPILYIKSQYVHKLKKKKCNYLTYTIYKIPVCSQIKKKCNYLTYIIYKIQICSQIKSVLFSVAWEATYSLVRVYLGKVCCDYNWLFS
jgi:hypothetical protein